MENRDVITMDIEDVWRLMKRGIAMQNYATTRQLLNDIIEQHQKDPSLFTLESIKGADAPSPARVIDYDEFVGKLSSEDSEKCLRALMDAMPDSDIQEVLEEYGYQPED